MHGRAPAAYWPAKNINAMLWDAMGTSEPSQDGNNADALVDEADIDAIFGWIIGEETTGVPSTVSGFWWKAKGNCEQTLVDQM